ncbi:MAG: hypothetical protein QGG71_16280 [Pirellulaceae bacterium]|nr:hypothetical protein [Pirellulaceae bacterium]
MRFSLKTMLTTISVAAVFCCIFFTLPSIVAIPLLGLIWMLAPPALIAGIVYGRGYGRAFSIGCVATGGVLPIIWLYSTMAFAGAFADLTSLTVDKETAIYVKLSFGATFVLMGMSGLTSMAVRWLSLRLAEQQPGPAPAPIQSPADYAVLQRRVTTLPANPSSAEHHGTEPTSEED